MLEISNYSCLQFSFRVHKPVKQINVGTNNYALLAIYIAAFHIAHQIDRLIFVSDRHYIVATYGFRTLFFELTLIICPSSEDSRLLNLYSA